MVTIHIRFSGAWRLLLGADTETIEVHGIEDLRTHIETRWEPIYRKRRTTKRAEKTHSIWDNSNILLNGRNIGLNEAPVLRNGDTIVVLPRAAGG